MIRMSIISTAAAPGDGFWISWAVGFSTDWTGSICSTPPLSSFPTIPGSRPPISSSSTMFTAVFFLTVPCRGSAAGVRWSGDCPICVPKCGDDICQEVTCLGSGCPCPESLESCPGDCFCGDKICNVGESFETCPNDCVEIKVGETK